MSEGPHQSYEAVADALELPAFDSRSARRAIWRGVMRTALTAVFLVFLAYLVLLLVSSFWQKRGDREARFQTVAGLGFLIAHPEWRGEPAGCCNTDLTSLELFLDVQPYTANALGPTTRAWLRLNILGRIVIDSLPLLPATPIERALSDGPPTKAQTRELLLELPKPIRASAIVELATSLESSGFEGLLKRSGLAIEGPGLLASPPIFLEPPYPRFETEGPEPEIGSRRQLAWPNPFIAASAAAQGEIPLADPLTQFQTWAAMLENGDNRNLGRLGLPAASQIKTLAANPEVHGFILAEATVESLRVLLDDPSVRSVNVADAAFDLGRTDIDSQ
jgi:hypothetical protein